MPDDEVLPQADWLTLAQAMAALRQARKLPEEAALLLHRHLAAGTLLARAGTILTEYADGSVTTHSDCEVPATLWGCCPPPPLGHRFWTTGDVWFQPLLDTDDLSLNPVLPTITIRRAKVSRDGLLAICRVVSEATGRGRRKGTGSLVAVDAPLVLEMHELVKTGAAASIYQAALRLAQRAEGAGTHDSKTKRLLSRYRDRFPNL